MAIISLDQFTQDRISTRICIIGAGAAGITLASELDGCGAQVLLLEAGTLRADSGLDDHYRGAANPPHPDPTLFRQARFGGTTSIWGGRCIPYDPADFTLREAA